MTAIMSRIESEKRSVTASELPSLVEAARFVATSSIFARSSSSSNSVAESLYLVTELASNCNCFVTLVAHTSACAS